MLAGSTVPNGGDNSLAFLVTTVGAGFTAMVGAVIWFLKRGIDLGERGIAQLPAVTAAFTTLCNEVQAIKTAQDSHKRHLLEVKATVAKTADRQDRRDRRLRAMQQRKPKQQPPEAPP